MWASSVPHVELAEWAELVIVSPCSATSLARIAHGDCSDLVGAIATATRAPIAIVPSMNDAMYASPAVQANLATLRAHGRWLVHPALGVEVAHRPDERAQILGPAPPAAVVVDVARHILAQLPPHVPSDAAGWERVWALPLAQLPWHSDDLDPAIDKVLEGRRGTLLDLGTGAGTVAIAAAKRGFAVTAIDVAPTALGHARARAGDLPILFALDDVLRSTLRGSFETIVDRGLLHCLPLDARVSYAAQIARWGGTLIVVAHAPGAEHGTHAVTEAHLAALFPGRAIQVAPTTLSGRAAQVFVL
jgi:SAM-dependent methyltransferase